MSKKYEGIFIIKELENEKKVDEIIQKINKSILSEKAELTKKEKLGLRKLAYRIKDQEKGYYYVVNYKVLDDDNKTKGKIEIKINTIEEVIKYMIILTNNEE